MTSAAQVLSCLWGPFHVSPVKMEEHEGESWGAQRGCVQSWGSGRHLNWSFLFGSENAHDLPVVLWRE